MAGPKIPPLRREEWTDEAPEVFAYWKGEKERENGTIIVLLQTDSEIA
jgi:hypothetical protein